MATEVEYDPFNWESGLAPESDWTIKDAKFEHDERFGGLVLKLVTDISIDGVVVSRDREQLMGIGQGWKTEDGGKTVVREDGGQRTFNGSSSIAKLIGGAVGVLGKEWFKGKSPQDSQLLVGQSFHMKRTVVGTKQDGNPREVEVPVGFADGASAPEPAKEVDAGIKSQLEELAKANDDHDVFMMEALDVIKDEANQAELEMVVSDASDSGLWATTRA